MNDMTDIRRIAEATITLTTPDQRAPRLVELLPPDGAAVSVTPAISARSAVVRANREIDGPARLHKLIGNLRA